VKARPAARHLARNQAAAHLARAAHRAVLHLEVLRQAHKVLARNQAVVLNHHRLALRVLLAHNQAVAQALLAYPVAAVLDPVAPAVRVAAVSQAQAAVVAAAQAAPPAAAQALCQAAASRQVAPSAHRRVRAAAPLALESLVENSSIHHY